MANTDIIVYITNNQKRVQECFEALFSNTPKTANILFVGSQISNIIAKYVLSFCRKITNNSGSVSFLNNHIYSTYGDILNRSLVHCKSSYVVILNDKIIVTAGWLSKLEQCLLSEASIGIVCPLTIGGFRQKIFRRIPDGYTISSIADFIQKHSSVEYPRTTSAEACLFIKREVIKQVGQFDANSPFPEVEYSHRARKKGFSITIADNAFVYYRVTEKHRCSKVEDDNETLLVKIQKKFKSSIKMVDPEWENKRVNEEAQEISEKEDTILPIIQKSQIIEEPAFYTYKKAHKHTESIGLDYIIPICNLGGGDYDDRLTAINYVIKNFLTKQTGIKLHLIIVEQVVDTTLPTYLPNISVPEEIDYTFPTVEYPIFVKPWLYNVGVKHAKYDDLIIAESEVCANQDYLREVLDFTKQQSLEWCFCWNQVHYLSQKCRDILVNQDMFRIEKAPKGVGYYDAMAGGWCFAKSPSRSGAEGGMVYFNKNFWRKKLGGANEFLCELGGNDNDLAFRANKVSKTYKMYQSPIYHLWHAISHIKKGAYKHLNMQLCTWLEQDSNYQIINDILLNAYVGNNDGPLQVTNEIINKIPVFAKWRKA